MLSLTMVVNGLGKGAGMRDGSGDNCPTPSK